MNSHTGIQCDRNCQIDGSIVSENGKYGIYIKSGSVIGSTIANNTKEGIYDDNIDDKMIVGIGDNLLLANNKAHPGQETFGRVVKLLPNACASPC